ncbi:hypothetical protein BDV29DRAFT_178434 [Aspergillus leporis]|uniref:Uncharacterized protein n=1 Tax=Aspergillus leporis TaxID=41062 RepID=A0A5N5WU71_9EURO|nr:hypothetical protein BDV29DRAFT_178434 [Aspergillus leporis]
MRYKITFLAFAATALASPAPEPSDPSELYDTNTFEAGSLLLDYLDPPSSIRNILATAIPPSFYVDMLDPASSSSILNEVSAGNFPAWYSSLPSNVKAWATTAFEDKTLSGPATADSSISVTASSVVAVSTSANTSANPTGSNAVKTSQVPTSPAATARSTSDASSSSASASASNSQSTGGASGPNGGVVTGVAGLAGAAGVLALVLAL